MSLAGPALGVSVKSVRLVAGRLEFYFQPGHTKDFTNSIRSFRASRSAQAEVRRVKCMSCSSCMSLNNVHSFVIDNCNGSPIENGLNNVCFHPPSRTFTVFLRQPADYKYTISEIARSTFSLFKLAAGKYDFPIKRFGHHLLFVIIIFDRFR